MGMMEVFKKLLGQSNEAEVRRLQKIADQVLVREAEYRALTDEQLQAKTPEFKQRLKAGETLDDILPDAFGRLPRSRGSHRGHASLSGAG